MSDQDALSPRVFLARHGETVWAKAGRFTGITEIELTERGIAQVTSTATALVGTGKLINPAHLAHVFVSPRKRARKTFELLLSGAVKPENVTITEEIGEWHYGDYEGLKIGEIRALRKKRGLDVDREYDIWTDGCEGGETREEMTKRLDKLIAQIREIQRPCMHGEKPADILIIAHGLVLRCFAKRWLGFAVNFPLQMILAPGAVAMLSYKNNNIEEPAFYLGLSLPCAQDAQLPEPESTAATDEKT